MSRMSRVLTEMEKWGFTPSLHQQPTNFSTVVVQLKHGVALRSEQLTFCLHFRRYPIGDAVRPLVSIPHCEARSDLAQHRRPLLYSNCHARGRWSTRISSDLSLLSAPITVPTNNLRCHKSTMARRKSTPQAKNPTQTAGNKRGCKSQESTSSALVIGKRRKKYRLARLDAVPML